MWRNYAAAPGIAMLGKKAHLLTVLALFVCITLYAAPHLSFSGDLEAFLDIDETTSLAASSPQSTIEILVTPQNSGADEVETLREFNGRVSSEKFVANVLSAFSVYIPSPEGRWQPAFAFGVPTKASYEALSQPGKNLLAPFWNKETSEFRFLLAVFAKTPAEHIAALDRIQELGASLESDGFAVSYGGASATQAKMPEIVRDDQLKVVLAALILGYVVAAYLLRSLIVALLVALPGILGLMAMVMVLAASGTTVTVLASSVFTLIIIIGLADSVHLYACWSRKLKEDADSISAMGRALSETAPAIFLTTGTTALCFLCVGFLSPPSLAKLGGVGAAGCVALFFATTVLWPTLLVEIQRRRPNLGRGLRGQFRQSSDAKRLSSARTLVLLSLGGFLIVALAQAQISTRFVLSDILPQKTEALVTANELDARFGGSLPVRVTINFGKGATLLSPSGWRAFSQIVERAEALDLGAVASYRDVLDGFPDATRTSALNTAGRPVLFSSEQKRELSVERPSFVVFLRNDVNLISAVESLQALAHEMKIDGASVDIHISERVAQLAVGADRTISRLLTNALAAAALALFVLSAAYKSWRIGAALAVPNLLPILIVSAAGSIFGQGVSIEIGAALIIAFGIALDDSIHVLEHVHQETAHDNVREAIAPAVATIEPVLLATTLVLTVGTAAMLLSDFGAVGRFGISTAAAILVAFACDVRLLPAMLYLLHPKRSSTESAQ